MVIRRRKNLKQIIDTIDQKIKTFNRWIDTIGGQHDRLYQSILLLSIHRSIADYIYICIGIGTYTYMYTYTFMYIYVHVYVQDVYVCIYVYVFVISTEFSPMDRLTVNW
jgi:hypothetical protein